MEFLKPEQAKELKKQGWDLIPNESGVVWFGSNFDEGWLHNVTEAMPIEFENADGFDFLVVAYRSNNEEN